MSRHTGTTMRPDQGPWRTTQCEAYYFFLNADRSVLQALVDKGLNQIAGSQRFVVTLGAVAMTLQQFTNMKVIAAGSQPAVIDYPEAAFFVMVSDIQNAGRTYIWTPFMYCGDVLATMSGREVFGFPKEFSDISMDGKRFLVSAQGLQLPRAEEPESFTPQALEIIRGGVTGGEPGLEALTGVLSGKVNIDQLREEKALEGIGLLWDVFGDLASSAGEWIHMLISPAIDFVLDRSRFDPQTQRWSTALLHANSPVNQLSLQWFLSPTQFTIANGFSHPIVSLLGLRTMAGQPNKVSPLFGCKLVLDFTLKPPHPLG